ncbi:zinc-binding dehydrogenase [Rhodoferax sp. 4810]|uniref:Zinc-binding dehydrogenase n=2 Tax=Thiospirillum jenense TaxID=1653858 RepID=A0A839H417_9GAMM|nr:zinc-binding dehydrogenase [Thiospirillum jenense]MBB1073188.1 zinc-binding dehydrogenase [Rhodoferax jenense]MBB1124651.1 zinc-binding dehydrogenase [Thiospirillum jenense]
MHAIVMHTPGDPSVLQYVELPKPQLNSSTALLVQLKAAGVNPVDTKIRAKGPMLINTNSPTVLGCDGAGIVTAIGSEVTRFNPGDAVWFCYGGLGGLTGNYADYILIDETIAQPMPHTLDFIHAAAAPLVLITAWEALYDRAQLHSNQTVLIHGGAGGVGHVAIQLACLRGARVATTISNNEKAALVRELGAECVINYRDTDMNTAIAEWTQGRGVDVVLDTIGPEVFRQSIPLVAPYGNLVTILNPGGEFDWIEARVRNLRISLELMLTPQLRTLPDALLAQGRILQHCAQWFDSNQLRIHIAATMPLAEAAAAHQQLEAGGMMGKLVLTPTIANAV